MYESGSLFIPADTYTQIRMYGCYLQLHAPRTIHQMAAPH